MSQPRNLLSELATNLTVTVHPDPKIAPRYDEKDWTQVAITEAIITEKGTVSDLPIVDFTMSDGQGKRYYAMISGRLLLTLAGALRGVNMRNHGTPEP